MFGGYSLIEVAKMHRRRRPVITLPESELRGYCATDDNYLTCYISARRKSMAVKMLESDNLSISNGSSHLFVH